MEVQKALGWGQELLMYMGKSFCRGLEEQELFPNRIRYTEQQYDGLTGHTDDQTAPSNTISAGATAHN